MNPHASESSEEDPKNSQVNLWIEEQKARIQNKCPESLQDYLNQQLDVFSKTALTDAENTLEIRNLTLLIDNAKTLNEAITHYAERMAPLMPSVVLKDDVKAFWSTFNVDQLESNALKKVMDELVEKVEKSEAEVKGKTEIRDKLLEKAKTDLDRDLVDYFFEEERDAWYKKLEALDGDEKKIKTWRKEVMKARNKKIKVIQQFSVKYKNKIGSPASKCRKDFEWLLDHCGGRNFYARQQHAIVRNIEENLLEAENIEAQAAEQFETLNEQYEALTGGSLDIPEAANNNQEPEESEEETVTENYESVEKQRSVLLRMRTKLQETMAYMGRISPNAAQDSGLAVKGGNFMINQMETNPDLPSYDEYVAMEAGGSQALGKAKDGTSKFYRYRMFNLPGDPSEFTADFAANLDQKISDASEGDQRLLYLTSTWYIDAHKVGTKKPTGSMQDILGHINHLLHSLNQPQELSQAA